LLSIDKLLPNTAHNIFQGLHIRSEHLASFLTRGAMMRIVLHIISILILLQTVASGAPRAKRSAKAHRRPAAPAQSQSTATPLKLSSAFQLGSSISNASVSPRPIPSLSDRIGLLVGGNVALEFNELLAAQVELNYVQKGIKQEQISPTRVAVTVKLDYIEIPLLAKVRLPIRPLRPEAFLGPYFALKVNSSAEVERGTTSTNVGLSSVEPFDFGIQFGGGLEFDVAPAFSVFANARYAIGLINIIDNDATNAWKNRAIEVLGGLRFSLF